MKLPQYYSYSSRLIALLAAGLLIEISLFSQNKPISTDGPLKSDNEADAIKCRAQLNIIHEALQRYISQKQGYPRWLSDLMPDYLHDANLLACPFVRDTGSIRKWLKDLETFPVYGDPKLTSYGYEFCTVKVRGLEGSTVREYKQRQMQVIGWAVPIARCLAHKRLLNLAVDGTVYKSDLNWEDIFVRTPEDEAVLHAPLLEGASVAAVRGLVRPRLSSLNSSSLDLSSYYNATLFHLGQVSYEGKLVWGIPEGAQEIAGIQYDIRGLVHLTGQNFPIDFPKQIANGIFFDRRCRRVHLLHGTLGKAPLKASIGRFVFHMDNGQSHSMPIVYGRDVMTRWIEADEEAEEGEPKPAWISPTDKQAGSSKLLRLYVSTWNNPAPESTVKTLDFISEMTASAPFLVAITIE